MTNAIDMIKADHHKVAQLYQQYQGMQGSQKQQLVAQICQELTIHAQLEESIFYPAVQQSFGSQGSSLIQDARKEHDEIKQKIRQLQSGGGTGANADSMVSELMSTVEDHVHEEESQILPQAQKQLGQQLNRTTRHWDTHAASCVITAGAVCAARSTATAAVTSGV